MATKNLNPAVKKVKIGSFWCGGLPESVIIENIIQRKRLLPHYEVTLILDEGSERRLKEVSSAKSLGPGVDALVDLSLYGYLEKAGVTLERYEHVMQRVQDRYQGTEKETKLKDLFKQAREMIEGSLIGWGNLAAAKDTLLPIFLLDTKGYQGGVVYFDADFSMESARTMDLKKLAENFDALLTVHEALGFKLGYTMAAFDQAQINGGIFVSSVVAEKSMLNILSNLVDAHQAMKEEIFTLVGVASALPTKTSLLAIKRTVGELDSELTVDKAVDAVKRARIAYYHHQEMIQKYLGTGPLFSTVQELERESEAYARAFVEKRLSDNRGQPIKWSHLREEVSLPSIRVTVNKARLSELLNKAGVVGKWESGWNIETAIEWAMGGAVSQYDQATETYTMTLNSDSKVNLQIAFNMFFPVWKELSEVVSKVSGCSERVIIDPHLLHFPKLVVNAPLKPLILVQDSDMKQLGLVETLQNRGSSWSGSRSAYPRSDALLGERVLCARPAGLWPLPNRVKRRLGDRCTIEQQAEDPLSKAIKAGERTGSKQLFEERLMRGDLEKEWVVAVNIQKDQRLVLALLKGGERISVTDELFVTTRPLTLILHYLYDKKDAHREGILLDFLHFLTEGGDEPFGLRAEELVLLARMRNDIVSDDLFKKLIKRCKKDVIQASVSTIKAYRSSIVQEVESELLRREVSLKLKKIRETEAVAFDSDLATAALFSENKSLAIIAYNEKVFFPDGIFEQACRLQPGATMALSIDLGDKLEETIKRFNEACVVSAHNKLSLKEDGSLGPLLALKRFYRWLISQVGEAVRDQQHARVVADQAALVQQAETLRMHRSVLTLLEHYPDGQIILYPLLQGLEHTAADNTLQMQSSQAYALMQEANLLDNAGKILRGLDDPSKRILWWVTAKQAVILQHYIRSSYSREVPIFDAAHFSPLGLESLDSRIRENLDIRQPDLSDESIKDEMGLRQKQHEMQQSVLHASHPRMSLSQRLLEEAKRGIDVGTLAQFQAVMADENQITRSYSKLSGATLRFVKQYYTTLLTPTPTEVQAISLLGVSDVAFCEPLALGRAKRALAGEACERVSAEGKAQDAEDVELFEAIQKADISKVTQLLDKRNKSKPNRLQEKLGGIAGKVKKGKNNGVKPITKMLEGLAEASRGNNPKLVQTHVQMITHFIALAVKNESLKLNITAEELKKIAEIKDLSDSLFKEMLAKCDKNVINALSNQPALSSERRAMIQAVLAQSLPAKSVEKIIDELDASKRYKLSILESSDLKTKLQLYQEPDFRKILLDNVAWRRVFFKVTIGTVEEYNLLLGADSIAFKNSVHTLHFDPEYWYPHANLLCEKLLGILPKVEFAQHKSVAARTSRLSGNNGRLKGKYNPFTRLKNDFPVLDRVIFSLQERHYLGIIYSELRQLDKVNRPKLEIWDRPASLYAMYHELKPHVPIYSNPETLALFREIGESYEMVPAAYELGKSDVSDEQVLKVFKQATDIVVKIKAENIGEGYVFNSVLAFQTDNEIDKIHTLTIVDAVPDGVNADTASSRITVDLSGVLDKYHNIGHLNFKCVSDPFLILVILSFFPDKYKGKIIKVTFPPDMLVAGGVYLNYLRRFENIKTLVFVSLQIKKRPMNILGKEQALSLTLNLENVWLEYSPRMFSIDYERTYIDKIVDSFKILAPKNIKIKLVDAGAKVTAREKQKSLISSFVSFRKSQLKEILEGKQALVEKRKELSALNEHLMKKLVSFVQESKKLETLHLDNPCLTVSQYAALLEVSKERGSVEAISIYLSGEVNFSSSSVVDKLKFLDLFQNQPGVDLSDKVWQSVLGKILGLELRSEESLFKGLEEVDEAGMSELRAPTTSLKKKIKGNEKAVTIKKSGSPSLSRSEESASATEEVPVPDLVEILNIFERKRPISLELLYLGKDKIEYFLHQFETMDEVFRLNADETALSLRCAPVDRETSWDGLIFARKLGFLRECTSLFSSNLQVRKLRNWVMHKQGILCSDPYRQKLEKLSVGIFIKMRALAVVLKEGRDPRQVVDHLIDVLGHAQEEFKQVKPGVTNDVKLAYWNYVRDLEAGLTKLSREPDSMTSPAKHALLEQSAVDFAVELGVMHQQLYHAGVDLPFDKDPTRITLREIRNFVSHVYQEGSIVKRSSYRGVRDGFSALRRFVLFGENPDYLSVYQAISRAMRNVVVGEVKVQTDAKLLPAAIENLMSEFGKQVSSSRCKRDGSGCRAIESVYDPEVDEGLKNELSQPEGFYVEGTTLKKGPYEFNIHVGREGALALTRLDGSNEYPIELSRLTGLSSDQQTDFASGLFSFKVDILFNVLNEMRKDVRLDAVSLRHHLREKVTDYDQSIQLMGVRCFFEQGIMAGRISLFSEALVDILPDYGIALTKDAVFSAKRRYAIARRAAVLTMSTGEMLALTRQWDSGSFIVYPERIHYLGTPAELVDIRMQYRLRATSEGSRPFYVNHAIDAAVAQVALPNGELGFRLSLSGGDTIFIYLSEMMSGCEPFFAAWRRTFGMSNTLEARARAPFEDRVEIALHFVDVEIISQSDRRLVSTNLIQGLDGRGISTLSSKERVAFLQRLMQRYRRGMPNGVLDNSAFESMLKEVGFTVHTCLVFKAAQGMVAKMIKTDGTTVLLKEQLDFTELLDLSLPDHGYQVFEVDRFLSTQGDIRGVSIRYIYVDLEGNLRLGLNDYEVTIQATEEYRQRIEALRQRLLNDEFISMSGIYVKQALIDILKNADQLVRLVREPGETEPLSWEVQVQRALQRLGCSDQNNAPFKAGKALLLQAVKQEINLISTKQALGVLEAFGVRIQAAYYYVIHGEQQLYTGILIEESGMVVQKTIHHLDWVEQSATTEIPLSDSTKWRYEPARNQIVFELSRHESYDLARGVVEGRLEMSLQKNGIKVYDISAAVVTAIRPEEGNAAAWMNKVAELHRKVQAENALREFENLPEYTDEKHQRLVDEMNAVIDNLLSSSPISREQAVKIKAIIYQDALRDSNDLLSEYERVAQRTVDPKKRIGIVNHIRSTKFISRGMSTMAAFVDIATVFNVVSDLALAETQGEKLLVLANKSFSAAMLTQITTKYTANVLALMRSAKLAASVDFLEGVAKNPILSGIGYVGAVVGAAESAYDIASGDWKQADTPGLHLANDILGDVCSGLMLASAVQGGVNVVTDAASLVCFSAQIVLGMVEKGLAAHHTAERYFELMPMTLLEFHAIEFRAFFGMDISEYNNGLQIQHVQEEGIEKALATLAQENCPFAAMVAQPAMLYRKIRTEWCVRSKQVVYYLTGMGGAIRGQSSLEWVVEKQSNETWSIQMDPSQRNNFVFFDADYPVPTGTRTVGDKTYFYPVARVPYIPFGGHVSNEDLKRFRERQVDKWAPQIQQDKLKGFHFASIPEWDMNESEDHVNAISCPNDRTFDVRQRIARASLISTFRYFRPSSPIIVARNGIKDGDAILLPPANGGKDQWGRDLWLLKTTSRYFNLVFIPAGHCQITGFNKNFFHLEQETSGRVWGSTELRDEFSLNNTYGKLLLAAGRIVYGYGNTSSVEFSLYQVDKLRLGADTRLKFRHNHPDNNGVISEITLGKRNVVYFQDSPREKSVLFVLSDEESASMFIDHTPDGGVGITDTLFANFKREEVRALSIKECDQHFGDRLKNQSGFFHGMGVRLADGQFKPLWISNRYRVSLRLQDGVMLFQRASGLEILKNALQAIEGATTLASVSPSLQTTLTVPAASFYFLKPEELKVHTALIMPNSTLELAMGQLKKLQMLALREKEFVSITFTELEHAREIQLVSGLLNSEPLTLPLSTKPVRQVVYVPRRGGGLLRIKFLAAYAADLHIVAGDASPVCVDLSAYKITNITRRHDHEEVSANPLLILLKGKDNTAITGQLTLDDPTKILFQFDLSDARYVYDQEGFVLDEQASQLQEVIIRDQASDPIVSTDVQLKEGCSLLQLAIKKGSLSGLPFEYRAYKEDNKTIFELRADDRDKRLITRLRISGDTSRLYFLFDGHLDVAFKISLDAGKWQKYSSHHLVVDIFDQALQKRSRRHHWHPGEDQQPVDSSSFLTWMVGAAAATALTLGGAVTGAAFFARNSSHHLVVDIFDQALQKRSRRHHWHPGEDQQPVDSSSFLTWMVGAAAATALTLGGAVAGAAFFARRRVAPRMDVAAMELAVVAAQPLLAQAQRMASVISDRFYAYPENEAVSLLFHPRQGTRQRVNDTTAPLGFNSIVDTYYGSKWLLGMCGKRMNNLDRAQGIHVCDKVIGASRLVSRLGDDASLFAKDKAEAKRSLSYPNISASVDFLASRMDGFETTTALFDRGC